MIQKTVYFVTVVEVIIDMGIEPTNELDWKVGDLMQVFWVKHTGHPPVKDNRKKTNGTGSRCFALYPEEWRGKIESLVRLCKMEKARQPGLFDWVSGL